MGFFASVQSFSDSLLTPVLGPLLNIPPLLTILIFAFFISLVSVLAQKHFTNQDRLKFLKKEMKKFQEQIRKHKDNPEQQLKINKKIMPMQGEMMKESLKPTLWMMIPFLFVFLWLSAHFAYHPIEPGIPFSVEVVLDDAVQSVSLDAPQGVVLLSNPLVNVVDGSARFELKADAGAYVLSFIASSENVKDSDSEANFEDVEADVADVTDSSTLAVVTKDLVVTKEKRYATPLSAYSGAIKQVQIMNPPLKPLDPFTIFGWRPGWLITYIVFSLTFSIALRKWMDVA